VPGGEAAVGAVAGGAIVGLLAGDEGWPGADVDAGVFEFGTLPTPSEKFVPSDGVLVPLPTTSQTLAPAAS
jgi:hypothetical protein